MLTIRNLLEISDSCLRLNGFVDPWAREKNAENKISVSKLNDRLNALDTHQDEHAKWMDLFRGIFAGNIFDWGALVVTQIFANNQSFGLDDAMERIQPRPWLIDGFDDWMKRLEASRAQHFVCLPINNLRNENPNSKNRLRLFIQSFAC